MYVSVRRETCPWPYSGLSPPHDLRTRVETVPATNATTPAGPVFFYILAAHPRDSYPYSSADSHAMHILSHRSCMYQKMSH